MVEILSVERTCLWRELLYLDNDFHLNLGFKFSSQTVVFTSNLDSRKRFSPQTMVLVLNLISRNSSLYRQFLYPIKKQWIFDWGPTWRGVGVWSAGWKSKSLDDFFQCSEPMYMTQESPKAHIFSKWFDRVDLNVTLILFIISFLTMEYWNQTI